MKLKSFIGVYHNILDINTCNTLMSMVDSPIYNPIKQTSANNNRNITIRDGTEILLTHPDHSVVKDILISASFKTIELYLNKTKKLSRFVSHNTDTCKFENFRVRRYDKGSGHFKEHCDIIGIDTMSRLFVIMFYLNTVDVGGETEFTELNMSIKPKQGSVLIFHPNFMFPHQSNIPISNNKYTTQTYIHYM